MNKLKFWKILAIVSCSLLVVIALTSLTTALPTSQYYDICKELDDIEQAIRSLERSVVTMM